MFSLERVIFGDLRLQDGDNSKGRVEYYRNSKWHTICSEGFHKEEADSVCKRLGFDSAKKFSNATSLQ